MTIFHSLDSARRYGHRPLEWRREDELWLVRATASRGGRRVYLLALARDQGGSETTPEADEGGAGA